MIGTCAIRELNPEKIARGSEAWMGTQRMQRNDAGEECSQVWAGAVVLRVWSLDPQH